MTRAWQIDLPDAEMISPNSRSHWTKRAKCAEQWRTATRLIAISTGIPTLERVTVALDHWPKDKRRRDPDRNSLVLKWCLDGIVDAGVIADDDSTHVAEVALRMHPPRKDRVPTWLLTIQEAAA